MGDYQGARVYGAGPLNGSGDRKTNIDNACSAARKLRKAGYNPFVPHVNSRWMRGHFTEEECLAWDFSWLDQCSILLRLPGVSPGSDLEVARARANQMIVVDLREDECTDVVCRAIREALR